MSYTYDKFLKPLRENDKILRIFDNSNTIKYNINPFSVQRLFVVDLNLNISLTGNRNIILDFNNSSDAKESLVKLQNYIDILRNRATPVVEKEIDEFVSQSIESAPFLSSINGSTASGQTFSISGDSNISGQITTSNGTHQIALQLTGIIPVERGGLGNQTFAQNELLIAGTNSIQSSGYRIDDGGENDKTLWTAERIKQQVQDVSPFAYKEIPDGEIDSTNKVFFLRDTPENNSEHIFLNGLLQHKNLDYTMTGRRINFIDAPRTGSIVVCTYRILETC
jgi:hypothetical protein